MREARGDGGRDETAADGPAGSGVDSGDADSVIGGRAASRSDPDASVIGPGEGAGDIVEVGVEVGVGVGVDADIGVTVVDGELGAGPAAPPPVEHATRRAIAATVDTAVAGCRARVIAGSRPWSDLDSASSNDHRAAAGEADRCDERNPETNVGAFVDRRVASVDAAGVGSEAGDRLGQHTQRLAFERADGLDDQRRAVSDGEIGRADHHGLGSASGHHVRGDRADRQIG